MSASVELATRWHLCDPKPARCACCWRGAEAGVEFISCDSALDRGAFVDPSSMAMIDSVDELALCATMDENGKLTGGCVRELLEFAHFKPQLHRRQLNEIKRLEVERDHWKATAGRFRDEANLQVAANMGEGSG